MAKIGFIGMGNMGYAMLKGSMNVFPKEDLIFTDVSSERVENVTKKLELLMYSLMQNLQILLSILCWL